MSKQTAGRQLSNVAFNWAQQEGKTLTAKDCSLLKELADMFDAEQRTAKEAAQSQPAPPEITTLPNRIAELTAQHGTLRAAAAVINIDVGYLSRLASGEKVKPGKEFLRRMGLRAFTTYERIK